MKIKRYIGGMLESNGYILTGKNGTNCFIIDPGYESKRFINYVNDNGLKLQGILLTHHHYDHVGVADRVRAAFDAPVYIHREDADQLKIGADVLMEHGDVIDLDGEKLTVLHTPGHTRGSVCFYCEKCKVSFTGDTIFNTDLGRTDFDDGSQRQMEESIINIIDKWPNDVFIYPGHANGCTMKFVRQRNTEFLDIVNK